MRAVLHSGLTMMTCDAPIARARASLDGQRRSQGRAELDELPSGQFAHVCGERALREAHELVAVNAARVLEALVDLGAGCGIDYRTEDLRDALARRLYERSLRPVRHMRGDGVSPALDRGAATTG